jgi:hypothetical protein
MYFRNKTQRAKEKFLMLHHVVRKVTTVLLNSQFWPLIKNVGSLSKGETSKESLEVT